MNSGPPTRFRCAALRRSGATDIRIVHATSADAARERLIASGLEPLTIEAVGPSLTSRLTTRLREGAWRLGQRRWTAPALHMSSKSLLAAGYLAATATVSLMIASWSLALVTGWKGDRLLSDKAAAIAHYRRNISEERARNLARPAMTSPGSTEILGRIGAILPSGTALVSATRDEQGRMRIEIDTSDPDQIRPIFADDPVLRGLKETGQSQTETGSIRVIWASVP